VRLDDAGEMLSALSMVYGETRRWGISVVE
jgi:hypothetical protein